MLGAIAPLTRKSLPFLKKYENQNKLYVWMARQPWRIISCRTLNNFSKLSVMIVICIKKQTNWPYKQYYVKTSRCFYQKLNHLFFKCRRNWRCAGIQIRKILEDHLWRLYTYNIYIVTFISEFTKFIQLYICCKFDPIKETFWSARIPYLE